MVWVLVASVLVFCVGAALTLWGIVWDRARGRRRCPRCWYDMSGAANLICPECGHEMIGEAALLRTRRRWRCGLLGMLIALLGGVGYAWTVPMAWWARNMPTAVLVRIWPLCADSSTCLLYTSPSPRDS